MKITKKFIMKIFIIVLTVSIITAGGLKVYSYIKVAKLCDDIKAGKEINTKIGHGVSYPVILLPIVRIIQWYEPRIPLNEACYYGNIQAVRVLLENGAKPNFHFDEDYTPLEAAIFDWISLEKKYETIFEIVKLLVENGANVNLYSGDGLHTPVFQLASQLNKKNDDQLLQEIILYLLDHGAKGVDENFGTTLLHYAIFEDKLSLSKTLIEEYEFDINAKGYKGMTPLMTAAERNAPECAKYLLEIGADKTLKNNDGKTAYEISVEKGFIEIAELIGE